ncbi:MAG TPA: hypothetical protein VJ179_02770, partial [Patescibacteria group bacterium]|nr:hypothetical protein [Patescibacteria group bacterium]
RLISLIRHQQPESKILIVSTSPTWKLARDAFYSGATDYVRKRYSKQEMLETIQEAFLKPNLSKVR